MLDELIDTVKAQTYTLWEHLILEDTEYQGCAATVNTLAAAATTGWLFLIADDDLLLPACLGAHMVERRHADIVYSPPRVEGEAEQPFHGEPPGIPSTCLVSKELWDRLGGYDVALAQVEDCDFYQRAMNDGATFKRVPQATWIYRFHEDGPDRPGNKSRGKVFGQR